MQWAAIYFATPREQLRVRCLAQGHLFVVLKVERERCTFTPTTDSPCRTETRTRNLSIWVWLSTIRPRLPCNEPTTASSLFEYDHVAKSTVFTRSWATLTLLTWVFSWPPVYLAPKMQIEPVEPCQKCVSPPPKKKAIGLVFGMFWVAIRRNMLWKLGNPKCDATSLAHLFLGSFSHSSLQDLSSSIRFKSGLWLGHSRTFTELSLSHSFVILSVCLGWLSCWKMNLCPSLRSTLEQVFIKDVSVHCCIHLSLDPD